MKFSNTGNAASRRIAVLGPFPFSPPITFHGSIIRGMGGAVVANQVEALRRHSNATLDVVTLTTEIESDLATTTVEEGVTYHVASCRKKHGIYDFCRLERKNINLFLDDISPDFILANFAVEYSLAAVKQDLPYVVVAHDNPWRILQTNSFSPHWILRYLLARYVYRRAQLVLAVNEYVASSIRHWVRGKLRVLHNPLTQDIVAMTAQPPSGTRIVSVGAWTPLKNIEKALLAFSLFRQTNPAAEYALIGFGLGRDGPAHSWAKANNAEKGVRFLGKLDHDQVLSELCSSSILLHPSLEEAACMAIYEAMALGLPVIAGARSGGVSSQLQEGRFGTLVDVNSPEEMSMAIGRVVCDGAGRQERTSLAREYCLDVCHPAHFAEELMTLINESMSFAL